MAGKLSCQFSPRGSLIVCNLPEADNYEDGGMEEGEGDVYVHEYPRDGFSWNKPVRKLVNQSHGFFMQLQKMGGGREVEPKDVVDCSRHYRSAVRECVIGLEKELENDAYNEDEYTSLKEQMEVYKMLETAWHLCEILFIETLPLGCLIQQLLEWVRWHNKETDLVYHYVMDSMDPYQEPDYWKTVYSLTLQGRTQDVTEILKHSPDCQQNQKLYASICELLRKMPMLRSVVGRSRTELRSSWYEWKQECKRRRDRGDFSVSEELHLLSGLLSGNEESFKDEEVKDSCQFWYEMMVGRLLYCSPLIASTDYDLHLTAQTCIHQYIDNADENMGVYDRILLTALQNNVLDVIKISSSVLSNWWFVAHLSNILNHRGSFVSRHLEYGSRLTEFVLLEYALSLFNHPSLWQITMDYLSHCPTQGRHHMMLLLERVPLEYDYKAMKVISVCNQYGLKDQAQSVCRVMARKAYTGGQLGNALSWAIRSKDSAFTAFIAEKYFDGYELDGKFKDLALLDNLGESMLLSKRLTFLGKYREVQLKYSQGDFKGAGSLLVNLLESGTVPKKYWITLLTDAIPLLELEDLLVFNVEQTFSLMRILHQTESLLEQKTDANKAKDHFDVNEEKIALLRLSLVRNQLKALL